MMTEKEAWLWIAGAIKKALEGEGDGECAYEVGKDEIGSHEIGYFRIVVGGCTRLCNGLCDIINHLRYEDEIDFNTHLSMKYFIQVCLERASEL